MDGQTHIKFLNTLQKLMDYVCVCVYGEGERIILKNENDLCALLT